MYVEIVHTLGGQILMTCALGVPKSSFKAFLAQDAYLDDFRELPTSILRILDAHFAQVERGLATKIDSPAPTLKPRLILGRGDSGLLLRLLRCKRFPIYCRKSNIAAMIDMPRHGVTRRVHRSCLVDRRSPVKQSAQTKKSNAGSPKEAPAKAIHDPADGGRRLSMRCGLNHMSHQLV